MRQTFANVLAEVDPERLEQVLRELNEQLNLPDCSDDAAGTTVKPCAGLAVASGRPNNN